MDKPYDIITEIKSENEVKVTGTGSTAIIHDSCRDSQSDFGD